MRSFHDVSQCYPAGPAFQVLVLAGAVLYGAEVAHAQDRNPVVVPLVELSTAAAPIVPSTLQSVMLTGQGQFLVSHRVTSPPQIAIYDTMGRFVDLYAREGDGPGEFRMGPQLTPGPAGAVWAWEQARLVRLDAGLRHIDTKNMGEQIFVSEVVPLSSRAVVADTRRATAEATTVSLMDSLGNVTRLVERAPEIYGNAVLAPAVGDGFWTLHSNQSVLRRYSTTGELLDMVQLTLEGFQSWSGPASAEGREGFEIPPRPLHVGLMDLGNDQMIVLTRVPDAHWKPRPSNQTYRLPEIDRNGENDTVVRLVDLRNGRTVGSTRVPQRLSVVLGARDLVYTTRTDSDGHVITEILRVQPGGTVRMQ